MLCKAFVFACDFGVKFVKFFLFFVDNTSPDIKIISPEPKESVNGVFTVTGFAKDVIGLESLSWQFGQETGNFETIEIEYDPAAVTFHFISGSK